MARANKFCVCRRAKLWRAHLQADRAVSSSSSTSLTPCAPAESPRGAADQARAAVSSFRVFHRRQDKGQASTAAWWRVMLMMGKDPRQQVACPEKWNSRM